MSKIYGADYGTGSGAVAEYEPDYMKSKIVRDEDGNETIPTTYVDGPTWESQIYGIAAESGQAVYQCIKSAKTQVMKDVAYTKEGVKYNPKYVVRNSISHWLSDMEESIGKPIRDLVITYPVYLDELGPEALHSYRELFEKNMKPGGVNRCVRGMISEPQAAAFSHWNPEQEEQTMMVVDSGKGTTDLCVVEFQNKNGQHYIFTKDAYGEIFGGDDWDLLLYEFFEKQLIRQGIAYRQDIKLLKELHAKCEEIKINMSTRKDEKVEFYLFANQNNKYVYFAITKKEYNQIFMQFWKKMKDLLEKYTKMIDTMQIDKVLLVGGTCSNVILQKHLKEYFSQGPYQNVKVIAHKEKTAVAIGAANYAHWVLEEQEQIHLRGLGPKEPQVKVELESSDSLGVKCVARTGEEYIGNIIRKGSSFPCTDTRVFGIAKNGLESIHLQVYWNESEEATVDLNKGTHIGEVEIDISMIPVTVEHLVKVMFSMPSQGIVNAELTFFDRDWNFLGHRRAQNPFKFKRR